MDVSELPMGNAPKALSCPHFPTRWQAAVWRNWNLVSAEILAKVLHASVPEIRSAAEAMGLEYRPGQLARWRERGFQTVIRRNWDLLPYDQLLVLLDWSAERLAFVLKEDDFFWVKLGFHKPACEEVRFRELSGEERARTAELRSIVEKVRARLPERRVKPFDFLDRYGSVKPVRGANKRKFDSWR